MTVLTASSRHTPPLTRAQTGAMGDTAEELANLLRKAVQHERRKATDWRPVVRAKIEELAVECALPNWDGYGADAISQASKLYAQQLVDVLPADLPAPNVVPDPDGEISLSWDLAPDYAFTASIGARGVISYAGILGRGVQRHGQEPFRGYVGKVLIESIREVASVGSPSG